MKPPCKILLVDDEAHIRKFIGLVLAAFDHPLIIEAAEGATALERYRAERPDLVLLDVNMPGMDGLQALAALRALDPDAVVVMLTSLANRHTVEECVRLGATDYLRKDLPVAELTARLREILADQCNPPAAPAP